MAEQAVTTHQHSDLTTHRHSNPTANPTHSHVFDEGNPLAENRTRWAVILTALMMIGEIAGGWMFNSMALLADGWHMSSHTLALGLSLLAYAAARKYAHDTRFTFGTWKIEVLGSYTSALLLVLVAGLMFYQSIERLLAPTPIDYNQAITIATLGLLVNLTCAWLLKNDHDHGHSHHHHAAETAHQHPHPHHAAKAPRDLNLYSAYIHVIADAATSVLAILALTGGKLWGANWLDPVMGIFGAVLVSVWAYGLLRESSAVLLDAGMQDPVVEEIREIIAANDNKAEIRDLHVWRVGKGKYACVLALAISNNVTANYFKQLLSVHEELVHITVETFAPEYQLD